MAGTDNTQNSYNRARPAIILVEPQMGENIGASARAMLNAGLTDLSLVRPRDGWPNKKADDMSVGALGRMPPVMVYDTVQQAVANCHYVLATTARPRDMVKPVLTPRDAASELHKRINDGQRVAVLFGSERAGLDNDDVALAHGIITIPLNPAFSSLNLGQAVLLVAYEWSQSDQAAVGRPRGPRSAGVGEDNLPASHEKLNELFGRLEAALEEKHFFRNPDQRPTMIRNLRNMLARGELTEQEVRTFHGMISALTGKKTPLGAYKDEEQG